MWVLEEKRKFNQKSYSDPMKTKGLTSSRNQIKTSTNSWLLSQCFQRCHCLFFSPIIYYFKENPQILS